MASIDELMDSVTSGSSSVTYLDLINSICEQQNLDYRDCNKLISQNIYSGSISGSKFYEDR